MNYLKRVVTVVLASAVIMTSLPFAAAEEKKTTGIFQCDWFDESLYYPFEYSDSLFTGDSCEYNHGLAVFLLGISMASFNSFDASDRDGNITRMFEECGFETETYGYETEGYDTAGVVMGSKKVRNADGEYTAVIAAVRSGNYGMEWGGNLRVGTGENHLGFDIGKEIILNYINSYFSKHPIQGKIKLFIPGYSRGGSIANLVGAELDDGSYKQSIKGEDCIGKARIGRDNTFVYTYEAPQCTRKSGADDAVYSNIFNIMNPNDYVPKFVMDDWGFTNYGVEYYLPSAENCANYSDYYENVCKEFDTLMAETDKDSDSNFYSEEDSRSVGAMLDSIMSKLAKDVFESQEYYSQKYEDGMIFIAGQYIGKKLNAGDALKALGVMLTAVALGVIPANMETIKSDGFRSYVAGQIAESDAGQNLSKDQIQGIIDVITVMIEFAKDNRSDVKALLGQLNTVLNVHQPYVTLAWMRSISGDDIKKINTAEKKLLTVSFNKIDIRYKANARIIADFDESLGKVVWSSSSQNVVSVDSDGFITAKGEGTAVVTARLVDSGGNVLDYENISVTVHTNVIEAFVCTLKNLFGKVSV